MREGVKILIAGGMAVLVASLAGCSSKKAKPYSGPDAQASTGSEAQAVPGRDATKAGEEGAGGDMGADRSTVSVEDLNRRGYLKDVYFDLDRADVRADQREALDQNGTWLRRHPEVNIVVEGHCDERGTAQYNMALGEKRAQTVTDYLIALGIQPSRVQVVSYGNERPFARGHNEQAWKENRRAHFVVTASK